MTEIAERSLKTRTKLVDLEWLESNFPCMQACPVHTQAGRYVSLIAEGRYEEAYRYARVPNPFASICGRVCGARTGQCGAAGFEAWRARGETRTRDLPLTRRVLCQLSYSGRVLRVGGPPGPEDA